MYWLMPMHTTSIYYHLRMLRKSPYLVDGGEFIGYHTRNPNSSHTQHRVSQSSVRSGFGWNTVATSFKGLFSWLPWWRLRLSRNKYVFLTRNRFRIETCYLQTHDHWKTKSATSCGNEYQKKEIVFMTISQTVKSLGCFVQFMFIKMNHTLSKRLLTLCFVFYV